jgi:hypothetical protein
LLSSNSESLKLSRSIITSSNSAQFKSCHKATLQRRSLELQSTGPIYESVVRRSRPGVRIRLQLLLNSIGGCFLLLQILFNFLAMREVVSNTRVNVAEAEGGKASSGFRNGRVWCLVKLSLPSSNSPPISPVSSKRQFTRLPTVLCLARHTQSAQEISVSRIVV